MAATKPQRQFIPDGVTARFGADKMATLRIPAPVYHALKLAAMVATPSQSLNMWLASTAAKAASRELLDYADGLESNDATAREAVERAKVCVDFACYIVSPSQPVTE